MENKTENNITGEENGPAFVLSPLMIAGILVFVLVLGVGLYVFLKPKATVPAPVTPKTAEPEAKESSKDVAAGIFTNPTFESGLLNLVTNITNSAKSSAPATKAADASSTDNSADLQQALDATS